MKVTEPPNKQFPVSALDGIIALRKAPTRSATSPTSLQKPK